MNPKLCSISRHPKCGVFVFPHILSVGFLFLADTSVPENLTSYLLLPTFAHLLLPLTSYLLPLFSTYWPRPPLSLHLSPLASHLRIHWNLSSLCSFSLSSLRSVVASPTPTPVPRLSRLLLLLLALVLLLLRIHLLLISHLTLVTSHI